LAIAGLLGIIVAVSLGLVFAGQATGTRLDDHLAVTLQLPYVLPRVYTVSLIVQGLADPIPAMILMVLLAAICWQSGQRRLALLAIIGPAAADTTVIVMKHLVGRTIHNGNLSYPSTHAAQSAAFAMVTALLVTALLKIEAGAAAAVVLGAAAAGALVMGWALVGGGVHYATDTLAGFCVAIAVVPVLAWCTDLAGDRILLARRVEPAA
jgi:undecaprenyl-diphosphatase